MISPGHSTNTGYFDFTAYLDIESTGENIDLLYSYNNKDWSTEKPEVFVEKPTLVDRSVENCYVKIKIANLAQNAEFDGSFIWDLVAQED